MEITPKIEIQAEAAGAIKDVVQPIVKAVGEVFSPVSELLGWGGDIIRIYRERTALKCFARTKQIASKTGIRLQEPPAKFITQFIENCSLEDENDEQLIECWAQLLVDAGTAYSAKHVFHANVLKQISGRELELLEILVRNGPGSYCLEHMTEAEYLFDFNFPGDKLTLVDKFKMRDIKKSVRAIKEVFYLPGLLILEIFIDDEESRQFLEQHPDYHEEELASWQILQSLQLVRVVYRRFIANKVEYRLRLAIVTELGSQFYFACHERGFNKKYSNRVRFKRTHKAAKPIGTGSS